MRRQEVIEEVIEEVIISRVTYVIIPRSP